ncbi:MAG TPA: hypothetical protein VFQ51_01025 [Vicinamibacteria bacterium]|nr:hypothetical protein [Vicinamibacteria bacterium]
MSRLERVAAAIATLALLLVVATDAVPLLRGPAPYPPEWQWLLRDEPPAPGSYAWPACCAAALAGLLALSGRRWFVDNPRRGAVTVAAASIFVGTAFQLGLLGMEPQGALRTLLGRVVSRTDTAYYTVAVSEDARDPLAFLDRHAALLLDQRKTAKHAATHPPGPVLYYRAWIAACEASPALTRLALSALDLDPGDGPMRRAPHTPASIAGALLGGLAVLALCAGACAPIALLLWVLGRDPLDAARIASLWPLVPGAALMSPQIDQALAFPVAGTAALLAIAVTAASVRARDVAAVGAGTLAFAASFLSYGAATFAAVGALAVAAALGWRRCLPAIAVAAAAAGAWLGVTVVLGHEPLAAVRTALAFHRETYTAPRGYALWLAFNPIDLALFLGAPVVAVGLLRLRRRLADPLARFGAAWLALVAALLVSGTVRGELGRIGVPLMALGLPAALGDRTLGPEDAAAMAVLGGTVCLVMRAAWILP